jgi:hypothetical protein
MRQKDNQSMSNTQYNPDGPPWPPQGNSFSYQQPYYYQQQQQAGPFPYVQPIYQVVPQQNNDNATVSLVLGILSIVFSGPIGLILGIVGLVLAKKTPPFPTQSSGLTTAGRVCSIIGIALSAFTLVFLVLYFLFIFSMLMFAGIGH